MGNYVIGAGNYLIATPSELGNYMIADINALAREINAELAGTSRAAPGLDGAAA